VDCSERRAQIPIDFFEMVGEKVALGNANFWNNVYSTKSLREVSWFSAELETSKKLVDFLTASKSSEIIDIGAGRSFLADELLRCGYHSVSIFDISEEALAQSAVRLKNNGLNAELLVGDITNYDFASKKYDLWHDRAVFHFLTEKRKRNAYIDTARKAVKKGGHIVIATFGPDGPDKCSGLEVCKYDATKLATELGHCFNLLGSQLEVHLTPFNSEQQFLYCWFELI
jgi:SAM-dependent methyltransferase